MSFRTGHGIDFDLTNYGQPRLSIGNYDGSTSMEGHVASSLIELQ